MITGDTMLDDGAHVTYYIYRAAIELILFIDKLFV